MKYKSAKNVLPEDLIKKLQEYVQGEYIYVPMKNRYISRCKTSYKKELEKRDAHIYTKSLEGFTNHQLAELYNLSESSIRRIIIKQRKGDWIIMETIKKILISWGLKDQNIKQIYDTAWQIGEDYVLKIYHDLDALKRNLEIIRILDSMDIPVGKIIPDQNGEQYIIYEDVYYFLSQKLEGSNLVQISENDSLALKMGGIIAGLHLAFQRCEDVGTFWNNSLLGEMKSWVKDNFEKHHWEYINKNDYGDIVSNLEKIYDELPVQLIHRDVHFGNFLFNGKKFSGYIDFDLSQRNIRIFDLCYFVLGLLSEEEKIEMKEDTWYDFVGNVFAGYEKKLPLSAEEKHAVPYVMECIELLFVAWFMEQDDVYCAEDAFKIFDFVRKSEEKIWKCIGRK